MLVLPKSNSCKELIAIFEGSAEAPSRPNALGGARTEVIGTPGLDAARYEGWELEKLISSHDPVNQFHRRKNYPAVAQERPYHSDVGEQQKVLRNVSQYNPGFVLSTDGTAQNGLPIEQFDFYFVKLLWRMR